MTTRRRGVHKITVSLASDLVQFADPRARGQGTSRSQVIGQALAGLKAREEEHLAAEGYRFYAPEAGDFAEASGPPVAEALDHDR
ncbi:MAG: hypothetical protein AB1505_17180 [Candidatus Latescibacterota bacterium]